jgi:hypothetical protein
MRNKLIVSVFALAAAALLASFAPRGVTSPTGASVDPVALTLAGAALPESAQADAF